MKLGQFLDKCDASASEEITVDVWAKEKQYTMESPCGYIWKSYHVVSGASLWSNELDEYKNSTLESCYIWKGGLEITVR